MAYRRRIYFTSEQRSEIWDRWQRGESMSSIGRGLIGILRLSTRCCHALAVLALTLAEREIITRGIAAINPYGQLPGNFSALPQRSAERLCGMVIIVSTAL